MEKSTHNRMTITMMTVLLMLAIWLPCAVASDEIEDIHRIRTAIIESGAEWDASATFVSGLTESEKANLCLGDNIPKPRSVITYAPSMRTVQYEERFDWRDLGMMTPVKHQGTCGSCWAFSAVGVIESKIMIDVDGKEVDLSEQHLVSGCCDAGNCDGGWPDWAFDYAMYTGIPVESCCPYVSRDTCCDSCDGWEDTAYKIINHVCVEPSIDDFKGALKEYGPMAVVVNVPSDWYYYRSGVYSPVTDVGWANHAVILTGWDDVDGCWFIKNSWGAGWGEKGYARVKYGDLEKYNYAYAITGVVDHGAAPVHAGWCKPVAVESSSEYSDNYAATRAIDNSTATKWFSALDDSHPSITFDLGDIKTIGGVRAMIFNKDVPMSIAIETSTDGCDWQTTVNDFEINDGDVYTEIQFPEVCCQYVCLLPDGPRPYGTCTEFDVFCVADDTPVPIKTTITITHVNGTASIISSDDVISVMLSQNGTKVVEWWS